LLVSIVQTRTVHFEHSALSPHPRQQHQKTVVRNLGAGYYRPVKKFIIPKEVMEWFRKTGSMGGKARAKKYTKEQLSEMGKKGGRPKGTGKKSTKRGKKV
jgi:hypothetical protein